MRQFFTLCCLLVLSSCQQQFFYRPATTQPEAVKPIFTHGIPSLRLNENGIDLALDLTARGQRDLSIALSVRNRSDSVFNFFPDMIRATGYNAVGQSKSFRVFSAEQYIRRRNTRNAIIVGAVAAATVAAAVAIADHDDRHNNDNNDYYDNDWYWIAATAPGVAWVPGPPPPFAGPAGGLLRAHTLYPGEELRGIVKVQGRSDYSDKIVLEIPIDGAYKRFVFDARSRRF